MTGPTCKKKTKTCGGETGNLRAGHACFGGDEQRYSHMGAAREVARESHVEDSLMIQSNFFKKKWHVVTIKL